jgi:hypothetical protein
MQVLKVCPKCQTGFECLESVDCWCNDPTIERVPLKTKFDCVCKDCLLWNQPEEQEQCSKHRWTVGVIDMENDVVLFVCAECHRSHELNGIFQE